MWSLLPSDGLCIISLVSYMYNLEVWILWFNVHSCFSYIIMYLISTNFIDYLFWVIPGELSFFQSIQWMDLGYSIFGYHHWSLWYKEAQCAVACFKQSHVCPLPNRLILDFSIMNKLYVNPALYPLSLLLSRTRNPFLHQSE
jgi:hypothetical protein